MSPDRSAPQPDARVRLAVLGDLLVAPPPAGPYARGAPVVDGPLGALLDGCDLVVGNLECTLAGDGATVATEPRVVATPEAVESALAIGLDAVSLANNHMFDCHEAGFARLAALLDARAVARCGAGRDAAEATAPAILERHGLRIALLGAADRRSGTTRFAGPDRAGVAELHLDRLTAQIRDLLATGQADHVLVSLHWGEERLLIPAPEQVVQARALIEAGASAILGHHPHVLQGMELIAGRPVIYSLGNFLADPVHFSDGDVMRWNRTERIGCVLLMELDRAGVHNVRAVPTFDDGQRVGLAPEPLGSRRLRRVNRAIARGVTLGRYRREHLWVKTIRPLLAHLTPRQLVRLRPRHARKLLSLAARALRAR